MAHQYVLSTFIVHYPNPCTAPEAPHPHPAAPTEFKQRFSQFQEARNKSSETVKAEDHSNNVYSEFWEAPARFWKPRVRYIEEEEMNAIMVRCTHVARFHLD